MKTKEFLDFICQHFDKYLRFRDHYDDVVHPSYHVSEVKTATYKTVDCGNMDHSWNETILQLWISNDPDSERAMLVSKVVQIMELVRPRVGLDPEAELMIEHGSDKFPPIIFHVGRIKVERNEVIVYLQVPTTQCKLELRGSSCAKPGDQNAESESCCGGSNKSCC